MIERKINGFFRLVCLCFLFSIIWGGPASPAEEAKNEILIGAHLPLSGAGASVGTVQKWAYERAFEDINEEGGIYVKEYGRKFPVRLILIDDETNSRKASMAVEELIVQKKVDLILSGQIGASGVVAGMITAEKYQKYYHGTVIWVPDFLEHNFQWATMYFIDIGQFSNIPFKIMGSLPEKERPKRLCLLLEDSLDGKQLGDGLAALAEQYGFEIVMREPLTVGGKDFTGQIIKGKSMGVDTILLFSNVPEAATIVRQMKEHEFNVNFFFGIKGTWSTEFYEALGKDADYVFCDGFWSEDYPFPKAKELGESFYRDFGKHSVGVGMYYAVCQILWQAIEKAGTLDGAKVRQAVLDNVFETVNGPVDYDERGIAIFPAAMFQWWDGVPKIIYPFEYSKFKIKIAPPWDER